MSGGDLPIVAPPSDGSGHEDASERKGKRDRETRVAGVLLAAGTSSRFGERNKLLACVDGEPIVRRAARTLLRGRVDPVAVVVGHEADRVREAVADLDLEVVHNDAYETGQASSVRAGIEAVRGRVDAAVIALGDMPFVSPSTVNALVASYEAGAGDALAAAYEGTRGNPVLFDARHFDALTDVDGDVGGRTILLAGENSVLVSVDDPGVRRDVDVPEDVGNR